MAEVRRVADSLYLPVDSFALCICGNDCLDWDRFEKRIMLVEFANERVHEGKEVMEAIVEACKVRFRPILMTTIAAAMGALPIAIGIGGMLLVGGRWG